MYVPERSINSLVYTYVRMCVCLYVGNKQKEAFLFSLSQLHTAPSLSLSFTRSTMSSIKGDSFDTHTHVHISLSKKEKQFPMARSILD